MSIYIRDLTIVNPGGGGDDPPVPAPVSAGCSNHSQKVLVGVRPREPFTPLAGLVLRQDRPLAEEGGAPSLRLGRRGAHGPANRNLQHHQPLFVTAKTTMLSPRGDPLPNHGDRFL